MSSAISTREDWIDYAKGIGIILVVLGHSLTNVLNNNSASFFYTVSVTIIYSFHMPLFFFIAGLFAEKSMETMNYWRFLKKKMFILLYPYLIWSFIEGTIRIVVGKFVFIHNAVTLIDLFCIPCIPIYHYWFLYALFFSFVMLTIMKWRHIDCKTMVLLAIIMHIASSFVTTNLFALAAIMKFYIFFCIGIMWNKFHLREKEQSIPTVCTIGLFILCEYVFLSTNIGKYGLDLLVAFIGIEVVIRASNILKKYCKVKFLLYLGQYSMVIYIFHVLVMTASRVIIKRLCLLDLSLQVTLETVLGIMIPFAIFFYAKGKLDCLYKYSLQ